MRVLICSPLLCRFKHWMFLVPRTANATGVTRAVSCLQLLATGLLHEMLCSIFKVEDMLNDKLVQLVPSPNRTKCVRANRMLFAKIAPAEDKP